MIQGVITVAFGSKAITEAEAMIASLRQFHDWPVWAISNGQPEGADVVWKWNEPGWGARWAKLNQDKIAPWDRWLYLDADIRVRGDLSAGFEILADGWDLAITPSEHQRSQWLWQAEPEERKETGCPLDLSLQGGVFFVRRNDYTSAFFEQWRAEWQRWQQIDQAALIRALRVCPIHLWLLGRTWNGRDGDLIEHRFGRAVR